jgi:hypothetical protein
MYDPRRSAALTFALVFLVSGAVVVVAGAALARKADEIPEETGLGRIWIGSILLAGATSLPELATDPRASAARCGRRVRAAAERPDGASRGPLPPWRGASLRSSALDEARDRSPRGGRRGARGAGAALMRGAGSRRRRSSQRDGQPDPVRSAGGQRST